MEKNQPFFDPYNFSNIQQQMPQMNMNMNPSSDMDPLQSSMNPAMYYEQQYMYYRYLTQMLDYRIRLKDYEKISREGTPGK
ncbi:MAG: hypothetical protein N2749_03230 [Clostridia bacterium]|nr:hypothetical protein [Clostridia bacterium]